MAWRCSRSRSSSAICRDDSFVWGGSNVTEEVRLHAGEADLHLIGHAYRALLAGRGMRGRETSGGERDLSTADEDQLTLRTSTAGRPCIWPPVACGEVVGRSNPPATRDPAGTIVSPTVSLTWAFGRFLAVRRASALAREVPPHAGG
jgi:hypothetical protein